MKAAHLEADKLPILSPDFSFYFFARPEVCQQRMRERNNQSTFDRKLKEDNGLWQAIHAEFLNLRLTLADTSDLSPEAVCEKIRACIESRAFVKCPITPYGLEPAPVL